MFNFNQNSQADFDALIKGIEESRKMLSKLKYKPKEDSPGKNIATKDQLTQFLKENTYSGNHQCCTAAIGKDGDSMAVLDGNFKVRGVENLRVVDMSVFPSVPGYNPLLYLYMIGAKAADVITGAK